MQKLILLIGVVAVSGAAIFTKLSTAPPLVIAGYRMLLAALLLLPPALRHHHRQLAALSAKERLLLLISGSALALHFAAWLSSLKYTSVASSTTLVSTQPIFAMLFSYFLFGERNNKQQIIGAALAIAGSIGVGLADTAAGAPAPLKGDALALIGAIAAAVYFLAGKILRRKLAVLPYAACVYGISAGILLTITALGKIPLWPYPSKEWALFAALAFLCTVIGHSSLNWALAYLPTAAVGIATLGEPIGASILALIIWREIPGPGQIAAAAVLLLGIGLYLMADKESGTTSKS